MNSKDDYCETLRAIARALLYAATPPEHADSMTETLVECAARIRCERDAAIARAEKAERLLGLEGRVHHEARNELRARAERAETALAELKAKAAGTFAECGCDRRSTGGSGFYLCPIGQACTTGDDLRKHLRVSDGCTARGHGLPHVVKHGETACSYCSRPMEYSGHGWLP